MANTESPRFLEDPHEIPADLAKSVELAIENRKLGGLKQDAKQIMIEHMVKLMAEAQRYLKQPWENIRHAEALEVLKIHREGTSSTLEIGQANVFEEMEHALEPEIGWVSKIVLRNVFKKAIQYRSDNNKQRQDKWSISARSARKPGKGKHTNGFGSRYIRRA